MKAVLKSVQPKWCELIASGKCTVLVCKTAPKLETPFKCYIYMTKNGNPALEIHDKDGNFYAIEKHYHMAGKVIGEFVCDEIYEIFTYQESDNTIAAYSNGMEKNGLDLEKSSCLMEEELVEYLSDAPRCAGYGWQISDLKIYDKPKGLGEFRIPCRHSCWNCTNPLYDMGVCEERGTKRLICQPQSWMYVEEI